MALELHLQDARIRRIITHPEDDNRIWQSDLARFLDGDPQLTRASAGEAAICAVQRLMVFLGYSTAASGAFLIDGDFGRGTNRGVAQFQVEHGLTRTVSRKALCYPCRWNTASRLITAIPDCTLSVATLERMAEVAIERTERCDIMTGNFDDAIFHLNALHKRNYLDCRGILARYGELARHACLAIARDDGIAVQPEWVLSIIRQETAGVIRPRFEQHYLSRLNEQHPRESLQELRMRSMSLGLGQIMGENFQRVGAASASALFTAPVAEQVAFVARFLRGRADSVTCAVPGEADFRRVARYYNGPGYEAHRYHEQLARWFREFRLLLHPATADAA
ncbi:N-acetylmuramidase domain-containing protein [Parahaliea aestuarii]|uniref:N-acetylmuramidase family protein n=1 Tax=Parahaliea aestuarii TaxID=1852021 RepID=A0A5C8ZS66_9GAMM|nr:N-acetylmuramidase domain-containing protein [Parahaliea aestuarii]TXS90422.1 N-acetylmuramidase family protein [Parahaliea aestuarii]